MAGKRPFWNGSLILALCLILASQATAQSRPIKVAYSAISAGIGALWLTHEEGIFKEHGLDSSLVYIRGGTTAAQALVAGEIQFAHLSPAPMMTAWAQGADIVWLGTTIHDMVFTLLTVPTIAKGSDLKGKRIGITRLGSASDLAARLAVEHLGLSLKDVTLIAMGGIPDILAGLKAGAVQGGILSPPTSTAGREMGFRPLVFIPDLGKEYTFSGIAAKRAFVQIHPEVAKAFMTALTVGAKTFKEDSRKALKVLKKYTQTDDRTAEGGYREYAAAMSSPPYPFLKGLEAVRASLADSTPSLKQADLKKFIDDRFVKPR